MIYVVWDPFNKHLKKLGRLRKLLHYVISYNSDVASEPQYEYQVDPLYVSIGEQKI